MAEYKTHIDEKTGVTFVEITGIIDIEKHLSFMKSAPFEERTLLVVTDMRNASLSGLPRGAIAKMVRSIKPLYKSGVRAAYVFSRGEDFGKGRLSLAQIEALGFDGQFRIFTDMDKAISWVQK